MGIKSSIIYQIARRIRRRIAFESKHSSGSQKRIFDQLIHRGAATAFGKEFGFQEIKDHRDFTKRVPVADYEDIRPYIERIQKGEEDVLWTGRPLYFAKTSGTTSGIKYLPITRDSISNHTGNARNALFNMTAVKELRTLFDGKMIFLSGSPALDKKGIIPTGRLSGIVNHWVPGWLRSNQLPSYETNCIEDWEAKVSKITQETLHADMRLISGIPPWVQMYYEKLLEISGRQTIKELFPSLQLFVYGGVNYEPYRRQLESLTGGHVQSLETYPASEGFIAFQDLEDASNGLLLQCNAGIFFEFIPLSEINSKQPLRLTIDEVETGVNYVLLVSTNAGLWSYNIGDTIEFLSIHPPRLRVTGRVKHFISAFGEHVIAKEVEEALQVTMLKHPCSVNEFTVAPQVTPPDGIKPHHEWWIEFSEMPLSLEDFSKDLDTSMQRQNLYYEDLIKGAILRPLIVRPLPEGSFRGYMQSIGKLGGQNKVPRLSNDRSIADVLEGLAGQAGKP